MATLVQQQVDVLRVLQDPNASDEAKREATIQAGNLSRQRAPDGFLGFFAKDLGENFLDLIGRKTFAGRIPAAIAPFVVPEEELPFVVEELAGGVETEAPSPVAEFLDIAGDIAIVGGVKAAKLARPFVGLARGTFLARPISSFVPVSVRKVFTTPIGELIARKPGEAARVAGQIPRQVTPAIATPTPPARVARPTGRIIPRSINKEKLGLSDDLVKEFDKRVEILGLGKRRVRTFKDMEGLAEELGMTPGELLKDVQTARITDSEVIALRNLINTNARELVGLEAQIVAQPARETAIRQTITTVERQLQDAISKSLKGATEAGRAVVAHRIMATQTLDRAFWLRRAGKVLKDPKKVTGDVVTAIDNLIAKRDLDGLAHFIGTLQQSGGLDKAIAIWKAGLLTSPTTHIANVSGNTTMATLENVKDIPAFVIDRMLFPITRKKTKDIPLSTLGKQLTAVGPATKKALTFLRTGRGSAILRKFDIPQMVNFKNGVARAYTQTVFRGLGAEDIFFREIAMKRSLAESAGLIAKKEALKGRLLSQRIRDLVANPSDDMIATAINDAEYAIFVNPNQIATFVSSGKARIGPFGRGVTEFIAPFVRTPTNIALVIVDYSPIGVVRTLSRQIPKSTRSQKSLVEGLGRSITGTGFIGLGALLGRMGIMTGNIPKSPAERAQWQLEGKQPNSILIRGKWRRLDRTSPIGNLFTLGADMNQLSQDKEGIDLVAATLASGAKTITEQTFLLNLNLALQALNEPERKAETFVERSVGSTIPTVVARFARGVDGTRRRVDNIPDEILRRIPFASTGLYPKRDVLGDEIKYEGGIPGALFDPFNTTTAKDTPVTRELRRLEAFIGYPSERVRGVKLTPEGYDILIKESGARIKDILTRLVGSEGYQKVPDQQKIKLIEAIVRTGRSRARIFALRPQENAIAEMNTEDKIDFVVDLLEPLETEQRNFFIVRWIQEGILNREELQTLGQRIRETPQ